MYRKHSFLLAAIRLALSAAKVQRKIGTAKKMNDYSGRKGNDLYLNKKYATENGA